MIEKLPEVEGFTSSYNETADVVVFYHGPTDFSQAVSLRELEAVERFHAWDRLAEKLNYGVDKILTQQLLNRYRPGE